MNLPIHVSPEPRSSRSAMASTSVKGRVCATQKPTEFYVCRKADPHAEVHDHSIPNFTITKGVGLWARTHLKKEDRTDTLPGRDSSLIKLVTRLFQADCHEWHGGVSRRAYAGGRVWTLHLTADSDRRSGLLWLTLTIRARAVFGRNSKHLEPVGTKSPGRSRGSHQNRPTPTKAGSVTAP